MHPNKAVTAPSGKSPISPVIDSVIDNAPIRNVIKGLRLVMIRLAHLADLTGVPIGKGTEVGEGTASRDIEWWRKVVWGRCVIDPPTVAHGWEGRQRGRLADSLLPLSL